MKAETKTRQKNSDKHSSYVATFRANEQELGHSSKPQALPEGNTEQTQAKSF